MLLGVIKMLGTLPILPLPAPPSDGEIGPLPPSQVPEQSDDEKKSEAEDQNKANKANSVPTSIATHTRNIGIVHPPADVRNIVDKTAQFVAKNGPEFENRIIANNAGNVKFNFLNASSPYHAYYQHRLSEFRAQNQASIQQQLSSEPVESSAPETAPSAPVSNGNEVVAKPDPLALFRPIRKVLEPPEVEQHTVRLPEGLTGEELDIIKLTAQFIARNGKSFLTGLTIREINNPQFHFFEANPQYVHVFYITC